MIAALGSVHHHICVVARIHRVLIPMHVILCVVDAHNAVHVKLIVRDAHCCNVCISRLLIGAAQSLPDVGFQTVGEELSKKI